MLKVRSIVFALNARKSLKIKKRFLINYNIALVA
tara:strand:- start:560 stop:661 length:102 start_codon:yes stop_codon:yes gene_type:complete